MLSLAMLTTHGVRRLARVVRWQVRWGLCSRSAIAGMCLMRKLGCIICGVGIIARKGAGMLMRIVFLEQTLSR